MPPLCQILGCCVSFGSLRDVGIGCQTQCEMIVPNFGHHQNLISGFLWFARRRSVPFSPWSPCGAKTMVPRTFGDLSSSPAEKNAQCAGRFRSNFNPSEELFTQPKHLHQLFSKLSALSHERTHALYSGFMEGGVSALSGWRRLFTVFFFLPDSHPFTPPPPPSVANQG